MGAVEGSLDGPGPLQSYLNGCRGGGCQGQLASVVIVVLGGVVVDLFYCHVVGKVRIPANGEVHAPIEAFLTGARQGPLQAGHDMIHKSLHALVAEDSRTAQRADEVDLMEGLVAAFKAAAKPREMPAGNRLRVLTRGSRLRTSR